MNSKTTVGTILTVIGLIPSAVQHLGLTTVPSWLSTLTLICSAIAFIYTGYQMQDKD